MWWDADIDAVMKRTASRPVPAGKVTAEDALHLGLWLSVLSVVMLALFANLLAAAILAFTIFFYAVIYTMWLKRSTPQNIVIGGAAGAFPPMIGWAIATGGVSPESILMFALIFMWTPPHFWALSLFMNDDYSRAEVPMMTVARGKPHTPANSCLPMRSPLRHSLLPSPSHPSAARSTSPLRWHSTSGFLIGAGTIARRAERRRRERQLPDREALFRLHDPLPFPPFRCLLIEAGCVQRAGRPSCRRSGEGAEWPLTVPTMKSTSAARAATAALGLILGGFVLLVFAVTIVKLAGNEFYRGEARIPAATPTVVVVE